MGMVLENGKPIGFTPTNQPFDYYGTYKLTLQRDGYQAVDIYEDIAAPWYEYPPFDFIAENLLPFVIRDHRELRYHLPPTLNVPAEQARDRAIQLQSQAAG